MALPLIHLPPELLQDIALKKAAGESMRLKLCKRDIVGGVVFDVQFEAVRAMSSGAVTVYSLGRSYREEPGQSDEPYGDGEPEPLATRSQFLARASLPLLVDILATALFADDPEFFPGGFFKAGNGDCRLGAQLFCGEHEWARIPLEPFQALDYDRPQAVRDRLTSEPLHAMLRILCSNSCNAD